MALKQARPPPKKKSKSKSKTAITEPSDVDESQIGDVSSEVKFYLLTSIAIICVYTSVSLMYRMMATKAKKTP